MTAVAEPVEAPEQPTGRLRGRMWIILVAAAVLAGVAWWALARGPLVFPTGPVLEAGTFQGRPGCAPDVRTRDVDTPFGSGTILRYTDGARCEVSMTVRNASAAAVTVHGVQRTGDHLQPLALVSASRDPQPASAAQDCVGCTENYVPFEAMTIAPYDEWEIALQMEMRGCRHDTDAVRPSTSTLTDTVHFDVAIAGVRRTVAVQLSVPWAVAYDSCGA